MKRQLKFYAPDPLGLLERLTKNAPIKIVDPIREFRKSPLEAALEELKQYKSPCPLCREKLEKAINDIKEVLVVDEAVKQVPNPNDTEALKQKLKELAKKYDLKLEEKKGEKK